MKSKTLALAAAAVMAGFLGFGSAQAANVMSGASTLPTVEKSQNTNVQNASHRSHKRWRKWRGDGNWRWRHRRHRFGGSGVFLGFGLAPFYGGYSPYYAEPYYYDDPYYIEPGSSRHVRYCLKRYRTYNVRTNTFRGYDGYLHRCRSPYRY